MELEKGRILPGRLLLKEIPEDEKTSSGLLYKPVDVVKKKTFVSEVVMVGDPLPSLDHKICAGDRVLHSPNGFVSLELEGENYRLMNAADVLFIYK